MLIALCQEQPDGMPVPTWCLEMALYESGSFLEHSQQLNLSIEVASFMYVMFCSYSDSKLV